MFSFTNLFTIRLFVLKILNLSPEITKFFFQFVTLPLTYSILLKFTLAYEIIYEI